MPRAAIALPVLLIAGLVTSAPADATVLGANKFDLAKQYVGPGWQDAKTGLPEASHAVRLAMGRKAIADARDAGLRFLRVDASGYWPVDSGDSFNDLALWQSHPDQYWALQDRMFDDLDRAGVQIVPVLNWNMTQFPVLGGDTLTTFLKDANAPSRKLFARFVREYIGRYAHRPTILFYELTNEMDLGADIDHTSKCPKNSKTVCVWTNYTTADMTSYARQMVALIHSLDPVHKVSSGYSMPRPSSRHLMQRPQFAPGGADWTPDSPDELRAQLAQISAPFDIISVHIYPIKDNIRFGRPAGSQYELVSDVANAAKAIGKPLYIGEFADAGATPFLRGMLDAIVRNKVDYASIWTWEYYQNATYTTHDTPPSRTSIEPGYFDDVIALLVKTEGQLGYQPPSTADAPRIVLNWPLACAVVNKPAKVFAVASDGRDPPQQVQFFAGDKPLGSASKPPYSATFDPAGMPDGLVTLKATAISAAHGSSVSQIQVRVGKSAPACSPLPGPH